MKCKHCHKEIILVPSAAERARKAGGRAEDYTAIFEYHSECTLELRRKSTEVLMRYHRELNQGKVK